MKRILEQWRERNQRAEAQLTEAFQFKNATAINAVPTQMRQAQRRKKPGVTSRHNSATPQQIEIAQSVLADAN